MPTKSGVELGLSSHPVYALTWRRSPPDRGLHRVLLGEDCPIATLGNLHTKGIQKRDAYPQVRGSAERGACFAIISIISRRNSRGEPFRSATEFRHATTCPLTGTVLPF